MPTETTIANITAARTNGQRTTRITVQTEDFGPQMVTVKTGTLARTVGARYTTDTAGYQEIDPADLAAATIRITGYLANGRMNTARVTAA